ncbi:MAG TPA: alpha-amylase family protein [Armatimonadota bacterium]|jgi:hypothetical protein
MSLDRFPLRTVHLDFHTSPHIPDIGKDFDAEEFAQTFADAYVDSVTVFAKCHHGCLYYDTQHPARHPGLPRKLNLLEEQVEALHRKGIRAPVYISAQVDEYAAQHHPEWVAVYPDGRPAGPAPLEAGWHTMDMSSPYQDYLAEQLDEVLRKFAPVDGIFLDMCWDQESCSLWALKAMRDQGFDPRDVGDRRRYAHEVAHRYMERYKRQVDEAQAGHAPAGVWFNSRPKTELHIERKFLRHVEVECLPTGGWGYAYFPYVARFVRPLGLPTLSHTARFHRTWGDFGGLKPEAALLYECSSILSMGLTNGVGDQLHPRGKTDKAVYKLIGKVYQHIQECEPWVAGGALLSQIAVMIDPSRGDSPGPDSLGVVRALQQLRHQFDLLPAEADLTGYELVIIPDTLTVEAALGAKLRAHLKAGGALLVAGEAALDEAGKPILPELGIEVEGESPFTVTYLRPDPSIADGLPETDFAFYERGLRLKPAVGAESLCGIVEPYFERTYEHFCSHGQTPPDGLSPYSAVVRNGRAITLSLPLFTGYGKHGSLPHRELLRKCLDLLLPEPLLRDGGPGHLETTVVRKGDTTVVHLLSFYPCHRTSDMDIIEDPIPLENMPLSVKLDRAPKHALLAPTGTELPFTYRDGRAEVIVSTTEGHVMVVFE